MYSRIIAMAFICLMGFIGQVWADSFLFSNYFQVPTNKPEVPLTDGIVREEKELPPFSGITVHGPFDVNVIFSPQQYFISYNGNGGIMSHVHYYIKNEILHIFTNQEFIYPPGFRINLTVEVPILNRFSYRGPGKVELDNMNADHFILNVEESGYVYICGRATRFDATLSENSRLNARCLYARTAFINTVDYAQAEIASHGGVSALAADFSDIYHFAHPLLVADYENTSGSVMRMEGLVEVVNGPLPPIMQPNNVASMIPTNTPIYKK